MSTEQVLVEKYGPLLTLVQVAELLDRSPEGLRIQEELATVRKADRIVVMADGQVAEQGNHAELMAKGGLYAGMVALQSAH